jgi:citrate lyase subunit gamma (acyl carrier protein)
MEKFSIVKSAVAGTLESADVQLMIDPNPDQGLTIDLKSSVYDQYGRQIREVVEKTLKNLGVTNAKVMVTDQGALDCTIIARTVAAVHRAAEATQNIDWEGIEAWNV